MRNILLSVILFFSVNATADYYDGNGLLSMINANDKVATYMYRGYVAGVQDSFNGIHFCVPANVKLSQSSEIVTQYIKANAKQWHVSAKELIINALSEPFPCEQ